MNARAAFLAASVCAGCGVTFDDGVTGFIDLGTRESTVSVRQVLVHAGRQNGDTWAIGAVDPTLPFSSSQSVDGVITRAPFDATTGHEIDVEMSTFSGNGRYATRLLAVPHRGANAVYVAGGIFPELDGAARSVKPSIQQFDPTTNEIVNDGPNVVTIHPAATLSPSGFSELAYDLDLGSDGQGTSGQVPMAMIVFHDEVADAVRLLAFLPFGRPVADPLPESQGTPMRYHRRALAFFDLGGSQEVMDQCPGAAEISAQGGSVETTEPAWLIDLPDALFSETGEPPPHRVSGEYNADAGWPAFTDLRLFAPPNTGQTSSGSAPRFATQRFNPAPPTLLVDETHGRGYLFVNRWIDEVEGENQPWRNAAAHDEGQAVLAGFSLAAPAGVGEPDPGACSRSAGFAASDPFDGLYESESAASMSFTRMDATAGLEAMSLSAILTDQDNNEVPNFQHSFHCTPFGSAGSSNNDAVCTTDGVSYQPVALDVDRQLVLVTQTAKNEVLFFDGQNLEATPDAVAVPAEPVSIALVDNMAYVACRGADVLVGIDLDSRAVARTVKVGRSPVSIAVDRLRESGPLLYVANLFGDNLTLYAPDKNTTQYAPACMRPAEIYLDEYARIGAVQCKGSVAYTRPNDDSGRANTVLSETRYFDLVE